MGHVLSELLGWPGGILLGNLIVDALFSIPGAVAYIRLHRKMDRHHEWHVNQNANP